MSELLAVICCWMAWDQRPWAGSWVGWLIAGLLAATLARHGA